MLHQESKGSSRSPKAPAGVQRLQQESKGSTRFHQESKGSTKNPKIPPGVQRFHQESKGSTRSTKALTGSTRSSKTPPEVQRFHQAPPGLQSLYQESKGINKSRTGLTYFVYHFKVVRKARRWSWTTASLYFGMRAIVVIVGGLSTSVVHFCHTEDLLSWLILHIAPAMFV